jgi:hypothetical protein
MWQGHSVTHPLLLLLHDKPGDSIPLNQHKKEKQQTTQECAGHWCEVIKQTYLVISTWVLLLFLLEKCLTKYQLAN